MSLIKQEDVIQSIADALQFISYYHPKDYIQALTTAWKKELTKKQIREILNIVEKFEIDIYTDAPEPDYDRLYNL